MIRSAIALDQGLRARTPSASNTLRRISFLFSAVVHGWLLGMVAFGAKSAPASKRPIYESFIRPNEKKIIWYRKVPDIVPATRISDLDHPQGELKSDKTLIVRSPQPVSSTQLVLQPSPQIKLDRDLKAPNLLGFTPPLVSPPEPKQVKAF